MNAFEEVILCHNVYNALIKYNQIIKWLISTLSKAFKLPLIFVFTQTAIAICSDKNLVDKMRCELTQWFLKDSRMTAGPKDRAGLMPQPV